MIQRYAAAATTCAPRKSGRWISFEDFSVLDRLPCPVSQKTEQMQRCRDAEMHRGFMVDASMTQGLATEQGMQCDATECSADC